MIARKMINRKLMGITAAVALATSAISGAAQAQDPIEMRLSFHESSSSDTWKKVFQVYADRIEELSEGRIKVTAYPDAVLHSVGDGFKAVAGDVTDVAPAYPVYLAKSFDLIHANELPGALPMSNIAAVRVVNELYPDFYREEYERIGVYLGQYSVTPGYDILTTKPVKSLADLKGMKIRASGGKITETVKRLGAVPVTMTIADAYTAFQQGVVDGIILSTADMVTFKLHEVGKYNFRIGIVRVAIPSALNPKFYDALPDDLKQVMRQAGMEASANYAAMYDTRTETALEEMNAVGIEVTTPSEAELEKIRVALEPMWEQFIEQNKDQTDPSAQELVDTLRELSAKYSEMSDDEIAALFESEPVQDMRP